MVARSSCIRSLLDESTRVWVADEDGRSVKKATGPTNRREIIFEPLSEGNYFLAFRSRTDSAEREAFRMKFSARGFNPQPQLKFTD